MAPSKEPDQAFMPTSNDTLYSAFPKEQFYMQHLPERPAARRFDDCAIFDSSHTSEMSSRTHTPQEGRTAWQPPNRERIPSASSMPHPAPQEGRTAWQPPHRERIPSANSMPHPAAADGPPPSDETFWYNLHIEALDNFERERATWKKMTDRLIQNIETLKEELTIARTSSRTDSAFFSTGSMGKENDQLFSDPKTVRRAHEKLRELSVVSPGMSPQAGSPVEPLPEHIASERGTTTGRKSSRLPSIQEDMGFFSTPLKRVSIAEPSVDPTEAGETPAVVLEDPPSPPTTAKALSPPPPEYIKDAGHTPARISQRGSFMAHGHETGSHKLEAQTNASFALDGTEDDPELKSPKILPTEITGDVGMLSALDKKLQEVAAHPEENEPEAVKRTEDVASAVGQGSNESSEPVVKLKTKTSMNFGVPMGRLR